MTANSFRIAVNTALAVTTEVCQVIPIHLDLKYLHLPKDQESVQSNVSEFEARFGTTQAFGCIGDTHYPIRCFQRTHKIFTATNNIIH